MYDYLPIINEPCCVPQFDPRNMVHSDLSVVNYNCESTVFGCVNVTHTPLLTDM